MLRVTQVMVMLSGILWMAVPIPSVLTQSAPLPDEVSASIRANKTDPLVGEPVQLDLIVVFPSGYSLIEWPTLTWDSDFFEIGEEKEIQTVSGAQGSLILSQQFTGWFWKSGDFATPETFVTYQVRGDNSVNSVPIRPLFFTIPSILDSNDLILRPPRPPIDAFYIPMWGFIAIFALIVGALYKSSALFKKHRSNKRQSVTSQIKPIALAEDKLIKALASGPYAHQLAAISIILREFLDQRFGVDSHSLTASELVQQIAEHSLLGGSGHEQGLGRLFTQVDTLRFAGAKIDPAYPKYLTESALQWMKSVDALGSSEESA
jgi:hypothetical protein